MDVILTLTLPDEITSSLDQAADEEGVGRNEIALRALKNYLFLKQFRSLREQIIARLDRSYTDEEVFDLVS